MTPHREHGPSDLIFATLIGAAALVLAAGWASLALACALTGHPPPNLAQAAGAIGGWTAHPADPAGDLFATPPAPWVVYVALLVIIAAVTTLLAGVMRLRAGSGAQPGRPGRRGGRGARWAARADLRPAVVAAAEPGRVVLGRAPGGLIAAGEGESVLVIGPPRSGKSAGIAIPTLLEWDGPVICTSVKPDLVDATIARRSQLGEALVFDPTMTASYPIAGWDPIASCDTWTNARKLAARLALSGQPKGGADMDFWRRTAAKLLAPMFLAAHHSGQGISDVLRWVDTQEQMEISDILATCCEQQVRDAATANWMRDPRQLSSIYTTAETVLEAFSDQRVAAATRTNRITPTWLLDAPNTLYLVAPADEQEALRPVFATLISELLSEIYRRATIQGGPLKPRVLVLLDELANVAPLPDLDGLATTGGGQGVQLVSVIHSLAQLIDRYGNDRAANIASSHSAKVFLSGLSDERSLDWVRKLTGDQEVDQLSRTTADRGPSRTRSTTWRPLAPGDVVREQAPEQALIVYRHHKPIRARLRLWFNDAALTALAKPPGSQPELRSASSPRRNWRMW